MSKVIIYKQDNNTVAVIMPTQEALTKYTLKEIAFKDVPAGKNFKIIDVNSLPKFPQEAWEIDDSELTDGVGSESNEFVEKR
jgi:hypothetical protein